MSDDRPHKLPTQSSIPAVWRPTLEAIVASLVRGDFRQADVPGVDPVGADVAQRLAAAVREYGDVALVELTEETWQSSVAMWAGNHWDALVDLRTAEEGRRDLVLEVEVREEDDGYRFSVHMIYVP